MTDEELKRLFDAMEQRNTAAHEETRRHVDQTAVEMRSLFEQTSIEMRRHFDVTNERIRHEVQIVAEAVGQLEEKVDREIDRLDEKMDRGFAETQAMIKFSHAELERRVRTLEQAFSDLQTRVERLETTTH
jgi:hypothetical protein